MGLPAGWELEDEQAQTQIPAGWELEDQAQPGGPSPENVKQAESIQTPLKTYALNALDAASIVGLPTVLAAKDALFGEESAKASKTAADDDPNFAKKGLIDRYRQNKKFYSAGMETGGELNPKAAVAGQLTPLLLPGPKGAGVTKAGGLLTRGAKKFGEGAVRGGVQALFRGEADTAGGDLEGTGKDVIEGAVGGGVFNVGVGAVGGALKGVGEKALKKLSSSKSEKIRSLIARYAKRKQEANAAPKNLAVRAALEKAHPPGPTPGGTVAMPGRVKTPDAEKLLLDLEQNYPDAIKALKAGEAGNAARVVRRFAGAQNRFGDTGIPSKQYAGTVAERTMRSAGNAAIKSAGELALRIGIGGVAGSEIAKAGGMNPMGGAAAGAALAGGSRLRAISKVASSIMEHPDILAKLGQRLPALGKWIQRYGTHASGSAGLLTAILASPEGQQALDEVAPGWQVEDGVTPSR